MSNMSFVDAMLAGHATIDQFDDYVDTWHDAPLAALMPELHDFLGMTWSEYKVVARDHSALRLLALARRKDCTIEELLGNKSQFGLAARSVSPEAVEDVRTQLKDMGKISDS